MPRRQQLGDHAAHRRTDDMRAFDAQRIHQSHRVLRHVVQRVRCLDGQPQQTAQRHAHRVGRAEGVEFTGQTDIAIVEANDAIARRRQCTHEFHRPRNQLRAEPHDQNDGAAIRNPGFLDFQSERGDAAFYRDLHRNFKRKRRRERLCAPRRRVPWRRRSAATRPGAPGSALALRRARQWEIDRSNGETRA